MSSFFRSAADISSSREDDSISHDEFKDQSSGGDYSIARVRTLGSSATIDQAPGDSSDAFSTGSAPASFHRDILLHALLEERCVSEAVEELRNAGAQIEKHHPRVQALAAEKYSVISQTLTAYGVVERGLDSEQLSPLRQQYRDRLALLSHNSTASQTPLSDVMSHVNMSDALQRLAPIPRGGDDLERRLSRLAVTGPGLAEPRMLRTILPIHPLLDSTRYTRDFEEFGILGKGGYGTVFHVKHKLDGRPYAVKKISLGPNRLRRIQEKGQAEMDNILLELRTLARLDHPNVVRYYSGWIEYASLMAQTKTENTGSNGQKLLEAPNSSSDDEITSSHRLKNNRASVPDIDIQFGEDTVEGAEDEVGEDRFATQDEQDVLFEDSTGKTDVTTSDSQSLKATITEGDSLHKMPSRSTIASVSEDSEVELISRSDPSSSDMSQSFTNGAPSSIGPSLALHIQMSLYSTTLSTFLSPSTDDADANTIHSLRHCFHAHASLRILIAIIDGVEYLHSEGIVHRDLKPGNIFLAVRPASSRSPDAIPLSSCHSCKFAAQPRPFSLQLCIGDFGLVSAIAAPDDPSRPKAPSRAVGTEIYRPETVTRDNHPCLDVFALGIVAFELVWKFGTRMERHETLHRLKKGLFPDEFGDVVQCDGLREWIGRLIAAAEDKCPGWDELRAEVVEMMRACEKQTSYH
ncbi:hypothetical protein MBLNU459_g1261t1 [Dothideomycetes sp. NU459]